MNAKIISAILIAVLVVVVVAQANHVARAATGRISAASASVNSVSCTSAGQIPNSNGGAVGDGVYECFTAWSDGTRCVSLTRVSWGTGIATVPNNIADAAALQCAFSGVVGVP